MKLDPRIKNPSLIYAPSNSAEIVTDEKGYFADELSAFSDLSRCEYCVLVDCNPDFVPDRPYCGKRIGSHRMPNWFAFYIPESSLTPDPAPAPAGKKYRPYTPEEFCAAFFIGAPVTFRKKGDPESQLDVIVQGVWHEPRDGKTVIYARMGSHLYAFDELFNDFEWWPLYEKDFRPFGVEVKE